MKLRTILIVLIFVPRLPLFAQVQNPSTASIELGDSRDAQRWQIGLFGAGGFPPNYYIHSGLHFYYPLPPAPGFPNGPYSVSLEEKLHIFNAGIEVGVISGNRHLSGIFRGKSEWLMEAIPLWVAQYPRQLVGEKLTDAAGKTVPGLYEPTEVPSKTYFGSSVTPWLTRWNFTKKDSDRIVPWAQLGGGLLWTNHKFPQLGVAGSNVLATDFYLPGQNTSVINFTPQVDAGVNFFTRKNRSVNFAVKAVHISNASLGDNNPGLNVTLQFSAGYSWWK